MTPRTARRRTAFALSLTAAILCVVALGTGGALASNGPPVSAGTGGGGTTASVTPDMVGDWGGGTIGCYNASATIASTTMQAHWCWDINLNLTDLSFSPSQGSLYAGTYLPEGIGIDSTSGGIGQHTASETFNSDWYSPVAAYSDLSPWIFIEYWVHVVGGSNNLDFVETGVTEG